jgi:ABC-type phosphate transport system auxiliary subunit
MNGEQNMDLRVVLHRLDAMDTTLSRINDSLERLVRVEERQLQTAASVERAFKTIEAVSETINKRLDHVSARVGALEIPSAINNRTSVWVERAFTVTIVAAFAVAGTRVFG